MDHHFAVAVPSRSAVPGDILVSHSTSFDYILWGTGSTLLMTLGVRRQVWAPFLRVSHSRAVSMAFLRATIEPGSRTVSST